MVQTVEITRSVTDVEVLPNVTEVSIVPKVTEVILTTGVAGTRALTDDLPLDLTVDGLQVRLVAAENLTFGDVCYLNGAGKWAKSDASASSTSRALVMATAVIAADAEGAFLMIGFARTDVWTWTVGAEIYLSETPGGLTQTAPITANSVTQVIGIAISADRMYFKPSSDILVHV